MNSAEMKLVSINGDVVTTSYNRGMSFYAEFNRMHFLDRNTPFYQSGDTYITNGSVQDGLIYGIALYKAGDTSPFFQATEAGAINQLGGLDVYLDDAHSTTTDALINELMNGTYNDTYNGKYLFNPDTLRFEPTTF